MSREPTRQLPPAADPRLGLCSVCRYVRRVESDRGSVFYQCELSRTDPAFPAYPRLPVLRCAGFTASGSESDQDEGD